MIGGATIASAFVSSSLSSAGSWFGCNFDPVRNVGESRGSKTLSGDTFGKHSEVDVDADPADGICKLNNCTVQKFSSKFCEAWLIGDVTDVCRGIKPTTDV